MIIDSLIGNYKKKHNIPKGCSLRKELNIITTILNKKRIFTIEQLKAKGPDILSKAYPGLSVNRINLLYEAIGEEIPFEYKESAVIEYVVIKAQNKYVLKEKYK